MERADRIKQRTTGEADRCCVVVNVGLLLFREIRISERVVHLPNRHHHSFKLTQEMTDMYWKRVFPIASVIAVGALAFSLRTVSAAPAPASTPLRALDDATIVAIFDAANTSDIETGELGAKMGSTKAVRDFGAMLARDHKIVRQQGRDLAKKLGVVPTPPMNDDGAKAHAAIVKKLSGLSGAEFDKAFLQNEVGYHDAVIAAVQKTLLPAIQNAELKDLVTKVAPAFVAHRDAAKNMLNMQM
jgi:putative membrane protein